MKRIREEKEKMLQENGLREKSGGNKGRAVVRMVLLFLLVGMLGVPCLSTALGKMDVEAATKIAKGAKKWNGNYYKLYNKKMKPADAQKYCKKMGGHLVCITSQKEQNYVAKMAGKGKGESYWIGATDSKKEGVWRWMNGDKWGYTSWSYGEPNNGLGRGEDYAVMAKDRNWNWVDVYGGYDKYTVKQGFICEWDMPKLNASKASITVGNTKALKVNYNKSKVKWSSSNAKVAKVSSKGVVTGLKKGSAKITAKISKKKYTCSVTVKDAKLSAAKLTLTAGKSHQLKVTKTQGKVKWSSNNTAVATVSKNGVVKGMKQGSATISAKVASSTYKCSVTVKAEASKPVDPPKPDNPTDQVQPDKPSQPEKPTEPSKPSQPAEPSNPPQPEKPADAEASTLEFYTLGGGDFICGISRSEVKFVLDADSQNVEAQILDATDKVVYTKLFQSCKKDEAYTFSWDGKAIGGTYVGDASCRVRIKAGKKETLSEKYLSVWEKSDFAGGNGSETNPYQVDNLDQLTKVGQHNECHFVQTSNIDGSYATFTAMFRNDNPFEGFYDGAGKTISNLMIKNTSDGDGSALFYSVGTNGVLKGMVLSNCSSNLSMAKTGTGYSACLAVKNSGKIQGCTLDNCKVIAVADGRQTPSYAGFVCARQESAGSVVDCKVQEGTINSTAKGWGSLSYAGGIVADNYGKIINCMVTGLNGVSVASNGAAGIGAIGGIVCDNRQGGSVINVRVSGTVLEGRGPGKTVGGIAAWNSGQIMGWSWDSSNGTLTGGSPGDCCPENSGIITQ